ncbi:hypothetical protein [Mycetocola tolaasinivorans]|nr:hypothetical protein [Mycetocola tolaasinivorans]
MHIDMPTPTDIERIAAARENLSVSIYMPTNPIPAHAEENRLRARGLFESALERVGRLAEDEHARQELDERLDALLNDPDFWSHVGRSLAVFATPTGIIEFRLPNELTEYVSVTDRFTITPLLRAVTFPQAAYVLALSQNGARLVEVSADAPAREVPVSELPGSAAEAVGLRSIGGRSAYGRIQGDEGRKVRLTQFARAVDHALRPLLTGSSLPLIIAAAEPLASIYRNLSGYHALAEEVIPGNPDEVSAADLATAARSILDRLHDAERADLQDVFNSRRSSGRALSDLSDLARAASNGAIGVLTVDMDAEVRGTIDDSGALLLQDTEHDVLEELARRVLAGNGRVLAVRAADLPVGVAAAGILRFAI